MRLTIRHVGLAICLAGLSACAPPRQQLSLRPPAMQGPTGRDFPQTAFAGFALDRTTPAEVQAALGPPLKQSTTRAIAKPESKVIAPGTRFSLTQFFYFYAPNMAGQLPDRSSKIAVVFFFDDRLFLYSFRSTLPGEASPPVDEQLLANLRQGKTTLAQTVALLGPPSGEGLDLLDSQHGSTQINYAWSNDQSGTVKLRTLNVFFDRSGRLSTYTLQDNSFPANSAPLQLPGPPPKSAPQEDRIPPVPQYDLDHT